MLRQGFDARAKRVYAGWQVSLRNLWKHSQEWLCHCCGPAEFCSTSGTLRNSALKIGGSESYVERALRAGDDCVQVRGSGLRDGQVDLELIGLLHEHGGTRRGGFEEREAAALRRVHRGVKRVGAPLNEKG